MMDEIYRPTSGAGRFTSILVANRGEIACRVLRTARELGYRTVAVYSEADRHAPHVSLADEAVLVGPAPVGTSYLDSARILEAAARTGAEAIHPGYGFLSENAAFARACAEAGRTFIGPSAEAIELMGNKAAAKRRLLEAGVSCVPGYHGRDQDDASLTAAAADIGFPVMIKAAAGGGGRGMRLVREQAELARALGLARAEALSAFGCGELILERALERPRHVEFQVFADRHGQVLHLGERDCSVQRRHQKVVEEAPCPVMDCELRARMGAAAVEAAHSIGYTGAGTVEFLLEEDGCFYFLEMNTRLQVEHPVTELVTGLDLVALQIAVAQGDPLPLGQDDLVLNGHAIEARLYAEDPQSDFMPSTGPVEWWRPPTGAGIRVDDGITTGQEISPFYDAMVAKIVAWGPDRETARRRLVRALRETVLFGPVSNRDYLLGVLQNESFAAGLATTVFVSEQAQNLVAAPVLSAFQRAAAAAVLNLRAQAERSRAAAVRVSSKLINWSNAGTLNCHSRMLAGGAEYDLALAVEGLSYRVSSGDLQCAVEVLEDDGREAEIVLDGAGHHVFYLTSSPSVTWLALDDRVDCHVDRFAASVAERESDGDDHVRAPMHGLLREILVREGEAVTRGQRLLVVEAMKMQHEVLAGLDGIVRSIVREAGGQVAAGELILEIGSVELAGQVD